MTFPPATGIAMVLAGISLYRVTGKDFVSASTQISFCVQTPLTSPRRLCSSSTCPVPTARSASRPRVSPAALKMLGLEEEGRIGLEPTWSERARPSGLSHHRWACCWQPRLPPRAAPFSNTCFHAEADPRMGELDRVGFQLAGAVAERLSPDLRLNYHPWHCGRPDGRPYPVPPGVGGPCGPGQPKPRGGRVPFCSSGRGSGGAPGTCSPNTESHLSTQVLLSLV